MTEKKKIYIFGASVGGETFLSLNQNSYEILAFLDNDTKKIGNKLMGYEIFSPTILTSIRSDSYDHIVISSMYIDAIMNQLNILGVPKEKLKFPPKNQLKRNKRPFEDEARREKATKLLCELNDVLKEEHCYLSFGTLLGIVRENQLLSWDDDIDFSIFPRDVEKILEKLLANINRLSQYFQLKIFKRLFVDDTIANISIHCYENNQDLFHISLACLNEVEERMYTQEVNITPTKFFEGYDVIHFNGNVFKVPSNHIGYLKYTYGDWKTPRKNTSYFDNSLSYKQTIPNKGSICYYDYTEA